jgi:hypothetical protein
MGKIVAEGMGTPVLKQYPSSRTTNTFRFDRDLIEMVDIAPGSGRLLEIVELHGQYGKGPGETKDASEYSVTTFITVEGKKSGSEERAKHQISLMFDLPAARQFAEHILKMVGETEKRFLQGED